MFEDDPYPPLITPRSPSYERASREFLHPSSTGNPQVIAIIARLSEAEQNASTVCASLAQMASDEGFATQLLERAATHQERRQALCDVIEKLGGSAPTPEECRQILVHAIDALSLSSSEDPPRQVLKLMRGELRSEYDAAIASPELLDHQRACLKELAPDVSPAH